MKIVFALIGMILISPAFGDPRGQHFPPPEETAKFQGANKRTFGQAVALVFPSKRNQWATRTDKRLTNLEVAIDQFLLLEQAHPGVHSWTINLGSGTRLKHDPGLMLGITACAYKTLKELDDDELGKLEHDCICQPIGYGAAFDSWRDPETAIDLAVSRVNQCARLQRMDCEIQCDALISQFEKEGGQ